jgi:hypothetical protein
MENIADHILNLEKTFNLKLSKHLKIAVVSFSIISIIVVVIFSMAIQLKFDDFALTLYTFFWFMLCVLAIIGAYDLIKYYKFKYWDMGYVFQIQDTDTTKGYITNRINARNDYRKLTKKELENSGLKDKKLYKYKEIPFLSEPEELRVNMSNPDISQKERMKLYERYKKIKKDEL